MDSALNELSKVEYSSYIPLDALYSGSTINTALNGAPVLTANVTVLQSVGIEFTNKLEQIITLFQVETVYKL